MMETAKITKFVTEDGTITYYNSEFDEHYHSKTGAMEEAFEKYAKPANLSTIQKENVAILDFCFGLGYNSLAGLVELMKNTVVKQITIIGIELDPNILAKIKTISLSFDEFELIRRLVKENEYSIMYKGKKIQLKLYVDDASQVIKELQPDFFDFVFFDPFSPKKCPQLWTETIFSDVFKTMKRGALLETYSCARKVRDAMKLAGFEVKDGPKVRRWAPSTLAYKL